MGIILQAINNATPPTPVTHENSVPDVDVISVSTQRYFPRSELIPR